MQCPSTPLHHHPSRPSPSTPPLPPSLPCSGRREPADRGAEPAVCSGPSVQTRGSAVQVRWCGSTGLCRCHCLPTGAMVCVASCQSASATADRTKSTLGGAHTATSTPTRPPATLCHIITSLPHHCHAGRSPTSWPRPPPAACFRTLGRCWRCPALSLWSRRQAHAVQGRLVGPVASAVGHALQARHGCCLLKQTHWLPLPWHTPLCRALWAGEWGYQQGGGAARAWGLGLHSERSPVPLLQSLRSSTHLTGDCSTPWNALVFNTLYLQV